MGCARARELWERSERVALPLFFEGLVVAETGSSAPPVAAGAARRDRLGERPFCVSAEVERRGRAPRSMAPGAQAARNLAAARLRSPVHGTGGGAVPAPCRVCDGDFGGSEREGTLVCFPRCRRGDSRSSGSAWRIRRRGPGSGGRHRLPRPTFYVEDGGESTTGPGADGAPLGVTRRRCVRSWKRCSTT
jgi:hypothetical protein